MGVCALSPHLDFEVAIGNSLRFYLWFVYTMLFKSSALFPLTPPGLKPGGDVVAPSLSLGAHNQLLLGAH